MLACAGRLARRESNVHVATGRNDTSHRQFVCVLQAARVGPAACPPSFLSWWWRVGRVRVLFVWDFEAHARSLCGAMLPAPPSSSPACPSLPLGFNQKHDHAHGLYTLAVVYVRCPCVAAATAPLEEDGWSVQPCSCDAAPKSLVLTMPMHLQLSNQHLHLI